MSYGINIAYFMICYIELDSSNPSLKRGRGDFSRPLDREAEASPTQRPPDK